MRNSSRGFNFTQEIYFAKHFPGSVLLFRQKPLANLNIYYHFKNYYQLEFYETFVDIFGSPSRKIFLKNLVQIWKLEVNCGREWIV